MCLDSSEQLGAGGGGGHGRKMPSWSLHLVGEATVCKGERVEVYTLSRKRGWDVFPGTMGTDIRADTPRSSGWGGGEPAVCALAMVERLGLEHKGQQRVEEAAPWKWAWSEVREGRSCCAQKYCWGFTLNVSGS